MDESSKIDIENAFCARLTALSHICNFKIQKEIFALYLQQLEHHGLDRATAACDRIIVGRESRDQFPSIREILREMGVTVSDRIPQKSQDENKAELCVDVVFRAMRKFGAEFPDSRLEEFREYVGTMGRQLIQDYSWGDLCSMKLDQVPTYRAQMRKSAVSILRASRDGTLNQAPMLPEPTSRSQTFLAEASDLALANMDKNSVVPIK